MKMRFAALAVISFSAVAFTGGCESASKMMASSTQVSATSTGLFDSYLGKLGDLTTLLKGVQSPTDAQAAVPQATSITDSLQSLYTRIQALPPKEKATLGTEYSGKIVTALQSLNSTIAPLKANPQMSTVLQPILSKVSSFSL